MSAICSTQSRQARCSSRSPAGSSKSFCPHLNPTSTQPKTMKKLEGKVAVVTGASKGIGASIAKHLAAEGASVVVNYSSSKKGADNVVADILAAGCNAIAVQANVAHKTEIERLFAESKKAFGQLDI